VIPTIKWAFARYYGIFARKVVIPFFKILNDFFKYWEAACQSVILARYQMIIAKYLDFLLRYGVIIGGYWVILLPT